MPLFLQHFQGHGSERFGELCDQHERQARAGVLHRGFHRGGARKDQREVDRGTCDVVNNQITHTY